LKDFPFTVWAVNLDWAAKNRDAVVKFSRAYTRGVRWLYDPKNKDQAIDILIRYSKQDKKDVEDTYDFMIGKIRAFSEDGRLSDDAFEKMMDALLDFGDIAAPAPPKTKLWDGSYADAADKQL
jgi:ABC-type nitrate/sulfonate/bicarbonate transport system substrate-binding protein